jgi:uncharacterized protein
MLLPAFAMARGRLNRATVGGVPRWKLWLLLACAAVGSARTAQAAPHPYVAAPVSAAQFGAWQRHSGFVPMTDGTRLAITWYTPAKGPVTQRFPVLLWYMPGHRESIDPRTGEIRPGMDGAELEFFTARGYVVAVAEMRGSGASFGFRAIDRGPQIGRDGKDLVDWIARQAWSDGRVGMIGASFQGFSQFATAAEKPTALKAIFPEIAGFDDYTSLYYPGGILNVAIGRVAYAAMGQDDRNEFDPEGRPPRWPSLPVLDEDGDGELADEIPQYQGDRSFLDGAPTYADGAARQGLFHRATLEHASNGILTADRISQAPFRDSALDASGIRYRDLDPGLRADRIAAAGIAVYNRGGWFDYHARDTTQWFGTLSGHTHTRLMMAPTAHASLPRSPGDNAYLAHFGDRQTSNDMVLAEKLRFFDRHVRGIRNGFEREPPVLIYVVGRGWRREDEWPLRRARRLSLSLDSSGQLVEGRVAQGTDGWRIDPRASSLSQGANRWNYGIASAKAPMSLDDSRSRRLEYTSAPLAAAREITGHPIVRIQLSASVATADVYAYLEDVAPDGTSLLVSEGQLRADFHRLKPAQDIADPAARLRVRPVLPYHGYGRMDQDKAPLANGRSVKLEFDLMPVAWLFAAGHRIRLSLAGADEGSFEPAPGQAVSTWQIHRGPGSSMLELPFVP